MNTIPGHVRLNCLLANLWRRREEKRQNAFEVAIGSSVIENDTNGSSRTPIRSKILSESRAERAARRAALREARGDVFALSGTTDELVISGQDATVGAIGPPVAPIDVAADVNSKGKARVEVTESGKQQPDVPALLQAPTAMSVEGHTETTALTPLGPSMQTAPPLSANSATLDADKPSFSAIHAFETRLLRLTDGMDVRDLDVLRGCLMDLVEAMQGEGKTPKEILDALEAELNVVEGIGNS